jgi:nucleotide-binding universal stress UspA family protein
MATGRNGTGLPFRRIFLAVDGSKSSMNGVDVALSIVRAMGSRVTIVHVTEPVEGRVGGVIPTEAEKSAEAVVSRVQAKFAREGVKARSDLVRYGKPHAAIVQLAKEGWCDLLVLGSSGDEGRGVYSIGSTAIRVAEKFRGPVLLVKRRSGFSKISLVVEVARGSPDIDFGIDLARSLEGSLNFLVAGIGGEYGDSALRWAMQRACDAGVEPTGAVIEYDPVAISEAAGKHGTETILVRRRRNLLSRIRGVDDAFRIAFECPCSVLLL